MESITSGGTSLRSLELDVAREIAHAFITATSPLEVYRLALARLTPLVRASFSSVFERDPADPQLLKLACAHNWPQSSARYLGQMRVRVGRGPTGRAVAETTAIEAEDVFADPSLREWWDPARELGFVSLISLPLRGAGDVTGALTFYFGARRTFEDDERHLLALIADQLAVAGSRAATIDEQRREIERLRTDNELLRKRLGAGEETRRMNDEFLSNISHELRTPLNAILGYATLLLDEQSGTLSDEHLKSLGRIESAANALLRLISDLLELSQLRLGRMQPNVAPEDAVHIARRAMELAGRPPAEVQVMLQEPGERVPLLADGEKIVKILENLLTNAYKFTPRGTVTLGVQRTVVEDRPAVEWVVADTGIGIAADQQESIFDEFRQVDGSSTRLYGGTGLGLALSRGLARLLGGSLTVQSETGRGSRFVLSLPEH